MDAAPFLLLANTVVLAVAAALLLYPVLAYAWNVAYTEELLLLVAAFVLLAAGYVASILFEADVVSHGANLLASVASFSAVWRLTNRFVRREAESEPESVTMSAETVEGGFRNGE